MVAYIIAAVVCFILAIACAYGAYYCFKHKLSNYVIEALEWYKSFWYKNRHTFFLLMTIILVLSALAFTLLAIGVF